MFSKTKLKFLLFFLICLFLLFLLDLFLFFNVIDFDFTNSEVYPIHENIVVTVFWVGEGKDEDNDFISNVPSAWDERWMIHFGGVDDPENRNGYYPADFIPNENPFYFALPYNDFTDDGVRKENIEDIVYWWDEKEWGSGESMLKNRWIKIVKGDKVVYAQWEDSGPFEYDDYEYVFGSTEPKNKFSKRAGLDLSPACADFLLINWSGVVDYWQFVDEKDVPNGPWKNIVTTSQVFWE